MAKAIKNKEAKGAPVATKIDVKDLKVGTTYFNYVKDLVKITDINEKDKILTLYNITGAFNQRIDFKNVNLVQKVR